MVGEAKYQYKNGKWYCAETFYKCPGYNKKLKNAALANWKDLHNRGITQKKDIPKNEQRKNKVRSFSSNSQNGDEHICCFCGGVGRFQGKNGNWYCSEYITQCPEIRKRNSERNKKLYKNGRRSATTEKSSWNKGLTKETDKRVATAAATLKNGFKSGRLVSPQKGKPHTDEEKKKISEARRKYLQEHPEKVPYLLNHSSKMSYPEQYFKELFEKEHIPLQYHKQIGIYQLDFYNEDLMKYIEIDGETHSLESVKKN